MKKYNVSVCLATYNGSEFIESQLKSIINQLDENDEIIIVDDDSKDDTVNIINQMEDKRIKIFLNSSNQGTVFSFNKAILLAKNDLIFLSDQDDIWIKDRVEKMIKGIEQSGKSLISSNMQWIDSNEQPIYIPYDGVKYKDSNRNFNNIIDIYIGKTNYFGCCMAFRKEFVRFATPIPLFFESHDLWLGLASNLAGANTHMDEITLLKRKHETNLTDIISHRKVYKRIWSRFLFTYGLIILLLRLKRGHRQFLVF